MLFALLTLPVRAPLWIARSIHDHARREFTDPAAIRAELERLETLLDRGEIDEETFEAEEEALMDRLAQASPGDGGGP
ncbi:MAG: gas vesicle protein GvpG [Pseudomonadota bacterium]